jgi:hypothetical protein
MFDYSVNNQFSGIRLSIDASWQEVISAVIIFMQLTSTGIKASVYDGEFHLTKIPVRPDHPGGQ